MDAFPLTGLQYIKGDAIDLAKEKGNHCVVVEFWATWCPPCRSSIPHLTELAHKYPNVKFVGITNEGSGAALPFVQKMGNQMDYAVACDPKGVSGMYMNHFKMQGIPAAVLIDKEGKMIWHGHPMQEDFEKAIKAADSAPSKKQAAPKVDLKKETHDSLMKKTPKELKEIAAGANVSLVGLLEKEEIVQQLLKSK